MKRACCCKTVLVFWILISASTSYGQGFDILDFDSTEEGPWSDIENTTLTVPLVPDGSIKLDGSPSSSEFGGFDGVTVIPGVNAWILDWPPDRQWDGPDDSSFTFWLAHDSEFLYVGVDAKDDIVNSDDPNPRFWRDDAIEIIVDANNDRANVNTDQAANFFNDYGGHNYVNYEGRFSRWDDDLEEPFVGWANAVDWTYGPNPDDDVYGVGGEKEGGWSLEVKFRKDQFEDPNGAGPIEIGDKMGFNIGMDDDDRFGTGPNGDASRSQDLELQYWWANRARPLEFDALALEDGLTIEDFPPEEFDWVIDSSGRLTHGGTGEIIFGGPSGPVGDFNANGERDPGDLDLLATAMMNNDSSFDLDGDGDVDVNDRIFWVETLANTYMGDSNFDGEFSSADFVTVFTAAKYETGQAATWSEGDWNGDKLFNSSDFVTAFTGQGYEKGPREGGLQVVPEPNSLWAVVCGWLTVFLIRRRRSHF